MLSDSDLKPELEAARPSTAGEEELQLQLALAMSKEEADTDEKKRRTDQAKLEIALEESKRDQEVGTISPSIDRSLTPQYTSIVRACVFVSLSFLTNVM